MDLNYNNIHTDDTSEYSLFFTFDKRERCYMSVTNKVSRITDKVEVHKDGDKWFYVKYELEPAMQIVVEYYYTQWLHEEQCDFMGFETEKLKKKKALANVKDIISQEFDLDKQFQINSFGGRK